MSRLYRIRISDSVTRIVHVGDAVASDLEILPILGQDRMREILAGELLTKGFAREGDQSVRHEEGGVVVSVDLTSGRVTAQVATTEEVEASGTHHASVSRPTAERGAAERATKRLHAELEQKLDRRERAMQRAATDRLEQRLRDLRTEMDGVVTRVTIEALKERASELGEIEDIHEDALTGELTIKVKV